MPFRFYKMNVCQCATLCSRLFKLMNRFNGISSAAFCSMSANTSSQNDASSPTNSASLTPFSSLYVPSKYADKMHKTIEPIYDDIYFKSIVDNIDSFAINMKRRHAGFNYTNDQLKRICEDIGNLVEIKLEINNLDSQLKKWKGMMPKQTQPSTDIAIKVKELYEQIKVLRRSCLSMEELVIPFVLNLPNKIREDVPHEKITIVNEHKQGNERKSFKLLDYVKLGYINECMYSSIIGPHSKYLVGIGAQLQMALIQYFVHQLRQQQFQEYSGLDFVKSVIVEASNSSESKTYETDSLRINRGHECPYRGMQQLHLAGSGSLESICAFLSKRKYNKARDIVRLFSSGAEYDQRLVQNNSVRTFSVTNADEASNEEMERISSMLWQSYTNMDLPLRLVKVPSHMMQRNEYARYEIQVNLPSQGWLMTSRISHHYDWLSRRLGLKDVHTIDAAVLNSHTCVAAIIENNQTNQGTFTIPTCINKYMIN